MMYKGQHCLYELMFYLQAEEVLRQTEEHYLHMYREGKKSFQKLLRKQSNLQHLDGIPAH